MPSEVKFVPPKVRNQRSAESEYIAQKLSTFTFINQPALLLSEGIKKRTFYGQADFKRLPSPPLTVLDYMCSETDFMQEKSHFHTTSRIPNSS